MQFCDVVFYWLNIFLRRSILGKETKGKANAQDGWNDVFESKEFLTTIFIEQGLAEELNNGNRLKRSLVPTVSRVTRRD